MSLFDELVTQALQSDQTLAPLRVVVEKELLHHDILREMAEAGLLKQLTFMGGTCLRACYGSNRLSEDLDFTGGADFRREQLQALSDVLVSRLHVKYGLDIEVSEPRRESGNVDTWKLKVITHPESPHLPMQRINIDICAIPSYEPRPMVLRNHYGLEMGTGGLILQAESRAEILANKLVALALRPNRIKNRDLWDIGWLRQQAVDTPLALVEKKIADHKHATGNFSELLQQRVQQLQDKPTVQASFQQEMRRFLAPEIAARTVENPQFWAYLRNTVVEEGQRVLRYLREGGADAGFRM
ncbi:MAG: nucleotidyl transferase AbiEii/AbiGii toxin family protein [Thiolinea sp.]